MGGFKSIEAIKDDGRPKQKGWKRKSSEEKFREVEVFFTEKGDGTASKHSTLLHVGSRLPKEVKPEDVEKGKREGLEEAPKGKKTRYRTGPISETAARRPLPEESTKIKVRDVQEKGESIKEVADDKEESWKSKMVKKSVDAFAADLFGKDGSYLKTILRRWPRGRNLTDEKINILAEKIAGSQENIIKNVSEKVVYDLENPEIGNTYPEERKGLFFHDIVDNRVFRELRSEIFKQAEEYIREFGEDTKEKVEVFEKSEEGKKEQYFTPEQSSKLLTLIGEVQKIQDRVEPSVLQEIMELIIREDFISQGIFSEDDFSRIVEYVNKWLNKFNNTK